MKNILLAFFLILSLFVFPVFARDTGIETQTLDESTPIQPEERMFERIIEVHNLDSGQIYDLVIRWFSSNFPNPNNIINYRDRDSGLITGQLLYNFAFDFRSDLLINIRDNALRFRISDTERRTPQMSSRAASGWSLLETRKDLERDEELTAFFFDSLSDFIDKNRDDTW